MMFFLTFIRIFIAPATRASRGDDVARAPKSNPAPIISLSVTVESLLKIAPELRGLWHTLARATPIYI